MFLLSSSAFGQETLSSVIESELSSLIPHGITATKIDQNNIIIRQANGFELVKNIRQTESTTGDTADLIVTPADLDTMAYHGKYRFFTELLLGDVYSPYKYTILDANKNGRKEIYGNRMRKTVGDPYSFEGLVGYEIQDSVFKQILFFPDSIGTPGAFGDVDGDGLIDMTVIKTGFPRNLNLLYTQSTTVSLPNTYKCMFDTLAQQIGAHQRAFYDVDGDGRDETIYKVVGTNFEEFAGYPTVIDRFDTVTKEFKHIFTRKIKDPGEDLTYTYGLSFGDFDGDGKVNIGTGSQNGYAYSHEYQGNNIFTTKLIAQVPTKNLYLTCVTNDFNNNGKPEVWFGGDTFLNGKAITRLFAFEATGDDQYRKVNQIDIQGLFSFIGFGMHSRDMDNDGSDELFVHLAQRILVFKKDARGQFVLWYNKINEFAAAGLNSVVFSSDAEDVDGDGLMEIFLEMDHVVAPTAGRKFTSVFKRNLPTSVKRVEYSLPAEFQLFQNYPNPFNHQTNIRFSIPQNQYVTVKIYNSLGKEIVELVNDYFHAGTYTLHWDGTTSRGSTAGSGIYFIVANVKGWKKTIKATFIK